MKKSVFDLDYQNISLESRIVASLERIAQAFRVLLWNESKEHALSPIQVQVLIFLLYHSDQMRKVSYLAGEFNMTKATISDTIKTLKQKGLIKKEYELQDTRSYVIQLTAKGREIAQMTSLFSKEIKAPIDKLHTEDKENLLLSLLSIINHLNKAGVITRQRMCFSCRFYKSSKNGATHFCNLMNKPLADDELRVDCPDYKAKEPV